jgi:hypothetical protein
MSKLFVLCFVPSLVGHLNRYELPQRSDLTLDGPVFCKNAP